MTKENDKDSISVADAYRLKHDLNKSIQYQGLNAREVTKLQEVSGDEWDAVKKSYRNWVKKIRFIPDWLLIVFGIIGVVGATSFEGWLRWIFAMITFYAVYEGAKRQGHNEGYFDGYHDGVEKGVEKTLGIDDEEAKDIYDRSIEMEMDERVVKNLDKHR